MTNEEIRKMLDAVNVVAFDCARAVEENPVRDDRMIDLISAIASLANVCRAQQERIERVEAQLRRDMSDG